MTTRFARFLLFLFAWPHEMLHLLALRVIGKPAVRVGLGYVVVPPDLTFAENVFVSGLPVFASGTLFILGLLTPPAVQNHPLFILVHGLMLGYTVGSVGDIGNILGAILLEVSKNLQKYPR